MLVERQSLDNIIGERENQGESVGNGCHHWSNGGGAVSPHARISLSLKLGIGSFMTEDVAKA